jgi:hypothetical protein
MKIVRLTIELISESHCASLVCVEPSAASSLGGVSLGVVEDWRGGSEEESLEIKAMSVSVYGGVGAGLLRAILRRSCLT